MALGERERHSQQLFLFCLLDSFEYYQLESELLVRLGFHLIVPILSKLQTFNKRKTQKAKQNKMAKTTPSSSTSSSSSSSSSWGPKLEKKLKSLADSSSKESIQTYATWIGFNRKHASVISKVFCDLLLLTGNNPTRQWLYWQIIHELLLSKHTEPVKWDKYMDLRTSLGENTVVPVIQGLGQANVVSNKLEPLLNEWDEHNVFGAPTLVAQIRRMLSAKDEPKQTTSTTTASTTSEEITPPPTTTSAEKSSPDVEMTEVANETAAETVVSSETKDTTEESSKPLSTTDNSKILDESARHKRRSSLSNLQEVEYDFESKNVPYGKVDSREFLDPCKAIATLQIARDLRNDTAVQLSSLLTTLPKDIQEAYKNNQNDNSENTNAGGDGGDGSTTAATKNDVLSKEQIHDYSMRIPTKILDLDMEEQIQMIKTFQELIKQQKMAREQLIHLLLKSRCHFGSEPAAKEFFELQDTMKKLERRKQLLGDALELEGLDSEIDTTDFDKELEELPKLTWYDPITGESSSLPNKKPKIS